MSNPKDVRGKRIGRYKLIEHLASGGMAEIYLGRYETDSGFDKPLVLKVLQGRFADNEDVVRMFKQEARLGGILNHPGIVDVFDAGVDDGTSYIAMEHIPGRTLTELVLRAFEVSRPLPLTFAAALVAQVADALSYLQEGRDREGRPIDLVHRDVSPTNIVIGESGQTKLIDFGIARQGRGLKDEGGLRAGKTAYMSPEQARGQGLDTRSDIFCLGTILYEITVGRRLWKGDPATVVQRLVEDRPPPPTFVRRDYPPLLELIVMKALEKRPDDRYQAASDMAADLEAYILESGQRVGNRQMASFLRSIYAPESKVSDKGQRRARAFEDGAVALDDNSDEIDFDRTPQTESTGVAFARVLRESGTHKATVPIVAAAPLRSGIDVLSVQAQAPAAALPGAQPQGESGGAAGPTLLSLHAPPTAAHPPQSRWPSIILGAAVATGIMLLWQNYGWWITSR